MKSRSLGSTLLALVLFSGFISGCDGDSRDDARAGILTLSLPYSVNLTDVVHTDFVANIRYTVPEIDPNVVEFGAVLLFIRDLENTWTALPFTYGVESPNDPFVDYTVTLGYAYDVSLLDVFVESSSNDDVVWDEILDDPLLGTVRDVRVVILQSFVSKNGVDLTDYRALQRAYGLPD